jgi:hypothetical protein
MEDTSRWTTRARRASRRFTTIEGWKEVGHGVYSVAGSGLRTVMITPSFDLESTDTETRTRPAQSWASDAHQSIRTYKTDTTQQQDSLFEKYATSPVDTESPFSDAWTIAQPEDPFQDPVRCTLPEPPYHIFSEKKKWAVVWIIGAAGLFSGLSSNIYFPSLDAIAKARQFSSSQCDCREAF